MGAGGAKLAPLHMEQACFLVPLSVSRRSSPLQNCSQNTELHSTPQERHRTHSVSGFHFRWSTLHGRVRVRFLTGCITAALSHARFASQHTSRSPPSRSRGLQLHRGPAGRAGSGEPARPQDTGYWTGLCHVVTDHSLYDVWRDLKAHRRTVSHVATSGQSAARLYPWHRRQGIAIGYPCDPGGHLGVIFSLTAPATTLYGAAVWRLPLHLLNDQPFCDRIVKRSQHTLQHIPSDQSGRR